MRCIRSLPGESASSERVVSSAVDDGERGADERDDDPVVGQELSQGGSSAVRWRAAGPRARDGSETCGAAARDARPARKRAGSYADRPPERRAGAATARAPRGARS